MPISDWLDLMTDKVKVYPFISRDTYGKPTYQAKGFVYAARVNYKQNFVRVATGEMVASRGYAIIATVAPMTVNDKIMLQDGSTPLVLVLNVETDEAGPLYTRIDFA